VRVFLYERTNAELNKERNRKMGNKKFFAVIVVCIMAIGVAGCANGDGNKPDASMRIEGSVIGDNSSNTQIQGESGVQPESSGNNGDSAGKQTDAELEEELAAYRQEREDMIEEENGLAEGGSPDEDNYSFDLSGSFYTSRFDTREITEAYAAARIYVTETLGIKPNTKMATYMCIDPRILAIYDDEDKGVAAGHDNSNIFVCEYCDENGVWQYLILVRDGEGSPWNVIHNGSSYKE